MHSLFSSSCLAALAVTAASTPVLAQTNSGTIQTTNVDGAAGIGAGAGTSGTIVNSANAKIIIDETYAPTDADNDGDVDGPFAVGSNRAGIRTLGGYTGNIINSGEITIEGNNSAGISLGGPLSGNLTTDGSISVLGNGSVGVRTSDVTGNVRIAGTVTARGQNAIAVATTGNITGALVVQGAVTASGYRTDTPPTDPAKLDADDLLQGGPALSIGGNVSGGVILAVAPRDSSTTDNDEDKDGIEDAKEGNASVTAYGAAPAVRIGAADRSVALGPVAGTAFGHGLIIDGNVLGAGTYAGVNGTGVQIGGLGGAVVIQGGMTVNGKVVATSNGADATAILIGSGATVPEVRVAGTVEASGKNATAIGIDAGSTVGAIRNSGTIKATGSGTGATAVGIIDRSGSVTALDNSGAISGTVAIDLSANATGATIRQTAVTSTVAAPAITGEVRFGGGNDSFDIADGTVTGTSRFGGGNNRLALSGDAVYTGAAIFGAGNDTVVLGDTSAFSGSMDFGGGADSLTLNGSAKFSGTLLNSANVALAAGNGTVLLDKGTVSLRSLSLGEKGVLGITLDPTNKNGTLVQVGGEASFAKGATIAVKVNGVANAEGRYTFLQAGSVTGAADLKTTDTILPYMFKSTLVAAAPSQLAIDIARKTTTEMLLNRSQASAYDAIYQALGKDAKVAGVFLSTLDGDAFRKQLRQMLPDHAGGTFEMASLASRAALGVLSDPSAPYVDKGDWGFWIQQLGIGTSKSLDDTASYDISGWGAASGIELSSKVGKFGVSISYLRGSNSDGGTENEVDANHVEAGAYWRANWGRFNGYARGSVGRIGYDSRRRFAGTIGTEAVLRTAEGDWNGRLVTGAAGIGYEAGMGMLRLRPIVAVDYIRLRERGYSETGGGDAFNLVVGSRTSDELAVSGTVAAGFDFGSRDPDSGWLRIEAEGGRRQIVAGSLGSTTAHFTGGQTFTLTPESRTSGWVGKLRAVGGGQGFRIGGEASAEEQQGRAAIALRASLMIGF